jgi:hypothetical protein
LCEAYTAVAQVEGERDAATSQPTGSEPKRYDKKALIKLGQKERYQLTKSYRERLSKLENDLSTIRNADRASKSNWASNTLPMEAEVREIREQLDKLEHLTVPYLPTLKLEPGSVGVFRTRPRPVDTPETGEGKQAPADSVQVVQVIDPGNMLVRVADERGEYRTEFVPRRDPGAGSQVGVHALRWVPSGEDQVVWVAGFPTNGLVDDGFCKLDGVFEYSGTKQYTLADGGTRTVHLITKVEVDDRASGKKRK